MVEPDVFRYAKPLGYICLTLDRKPLDMAAPMHLADVASRHPAMLVFHREYHDCARCREDRKRIGAEKLAAWADPDGKLNYRYSDDYWCNQCQGTGWDVESHDEATERLDILTVARQLQALDEKTLLAAIPLQDFMLVSSRRPRNSWPERELAAEIKRRFELHAEV